MDPLALAVPHETFYVILAPRPGHGTVEKSTLLNREILLFLELTMIFKVHKKSELISKLREADEDLKNYEKKQNMNLNL